MQSNQVRAECQKDNVKLVMQKSAKKSGRETVEQHVPNEGEDNHNATWALHVLSLGD